MTFLKNLKQCLIALDQFVFCVLGTIFSLFKTSHRVYADETLSAYLYRQKKYWYINAVRVLVDSIFFIFTFKFNHCEESYLSELNRTQSPKI